MVLIRIQVLRSLILAGFDNFRLRASDFRSMTSDLRALTSDLRPRISDFRPQISDFGSLPSGLRSQTSDLGSRISEFRSQTSDLRSRVSDLRSQTTDLGSQTSAIRQPRRHSIRNETGSPHKSSALPWGNRPGEMQRLEFSSPRQINFVCGRRNPNVLQYFPAEASG